MTAPTTSTALPAPTRFRLVAMLSTAALALACGSEEAAPSAPEASTPDRPAAAAAPAKPISVAKVRRPNNKRNPGDLGTTIPNDFPSDIPFAEGAETRNVRVAPKNNGTMVMLGSSQSPDSVGSYYRNALPEKGWQIESLDDVDGIMLITANKPGRTLMVIVEPENDGSLISLISGD